MHEEPPGWYSRGYLPHYDDGAKLQVVTYRLADSLPAEVLARLEEQALDDVRQRAEIDRYLDAGHGTCLLRETGNATIVAHAWRHFHGAKYNLHAWVVMPNHVHVLLAPIPRFTLTEIIQSQKSFTAKAILRGVPPGSEGLRPASTSGRAARRIWQPDYHDRFIRNEAHYTAAVDYIHQNPIKAGLVRRAEDWIWSSARSWGRGFLPGSAGVPPASDGGPEARAPRG